MANVTVNISRNGVAQPATRVTPSDLDRSFDVHEFIRNNRIHVEHGSLISQADPLVLIHPRELTPENEPKLRAKLHKAYTADAYSFFDNPAQAALSSALGSLVPLSTEAKEAAMSRQFRDWMKESREGEDVDFAKLANRKREPFHAVIEQYMKEPEIQPEVSEFSKNAIGMYLMVEEALHRKGYRGHIAQFAYGVGNAEGFVAKLSQHLGFETQEFIDTARTEGPESVGRLLGLDEQYIQEVSRLTDNLPSHRFSANAVANWSIGRRMPGMQFSGVEEKMNAGVMPRIQAKMLAARMQLGARDVPEHIKNTEQQVAGMISFLPPKLSEALYLLGTEIAYTPEHTLHSISDVPAYGFHRRIVNNPDDVDGIYHIFISGKEDAEQSVRVLVHEAHHLLFPATFTKQEIQAVDELADHDKHRLKALKELMDQWMAGDDRTKAQVVNVLNRPEFAVEGQNFGEMIGGKEMLTFYHQVQHAYDRLQIDSEFYHRSGYSDPESRFQEVNSRYSELRYVRLREDPNMLKFIVPGQTAIYDHIYMPHVEAQLEGLRDRQTVKDQVEAVQQRNSRPQVLASSVAGSGLMSVDAETLRDAQETTFQNPNDIPDLQITGGSSVQHDQLYHSHIELR